MAVAREKDPETLFWLEFHSASLWEYFHYFFSNVQGWPLALVMVLCTDWLEVINIGAFNP